ncbi:MAG: hypothetical protein CFE43_07765 [Burkholderiales bacterium PBB3]|nr:MAG: hypothetical protein CFE43_07765 [Burkholderiales bacterium PBB3]
MSFLSESRLKKLTAFCHRAWGRYTVSLLGLMMACVGGDSQAYVVTITAGVKAIFLQVGVGTMTGGNFNAGGVPGNNATVNTVSVTVPAASLGTGALAMTSNSTVVTSPWDGFTYCATPAEVYVGGFFRTPGASANATLTVTAPTNLTSVAGSTIAFNNISWISGGIGDATSTIPSGTFVGGAAQTLLSVARNTWFESCLRFNYANSLVVASGTFTGRVTYTLTSP